MKKFAVVLLSGVFLCLIACANQLPVVESQPVASSKPTPAVSVKPTLPWDIEIQKEAPAYDQYFSQTIDYGYSSMGSEDMELNVLGGGNLDGHHLSYAENELYIESNSGARLWTVANIPNLDVLIYDSQWIYALLDGKELFRMDYWGENREVLFKDESGLIAELNSSFLLADDMVMYFFAGDPSGAISLYRLFVPESRVDVMYQYEPQNADLLHYPAWNFLDSEAADQEPFYHIYGVYPISNHEVIWTTDNPEFYTLCRELWADSELRQKYLGDGARESSEVIGHIEMDYKVSHATQHYLNASTNTYLQKGMTFYSDGASGDTWWID